MSTPTAAQIMNLNPSRKKQNRAIDESIKTHKTFNDILISVYQKGFRDARHEVSEMMERP